MEARFRDLVAHLQPRPEYLRLFNAIVLDQWKERQRSQRAKRARLERYISPLWQRLDDGSATVRGQSSVPIEARTNIGVEGQIG